MAENGSNSMNSYSQVFRCGRNQLTGPFPSHAKIAADFH